MTDPKKMVIVEVTGCVNLEGVMCTVPFEEVDGRPLCIMCVDRIKMEKCPAGEKIENVTVMHHFDCPHCGKELEDTGKHRRLPA